MMIALELTEIVSCQDIHGHRENFAFLAVIYV
jgi:hypothetical protein